MSGTGPEWAGKAEAALTAAGWRVHEPADRKLGVEYEAVRVRPGADRVLFVLYVRRAMCGIVVSGPSDSDPETLFDAAEAYAARVATIDKNRVWREQGLPPFQYVTHGAAWHFRNILDGERLDGTSAPDAPQGGSRSRRVFAPHQPTTLDRWMSEAEENPDTPTLRARLRRLPDERLDHRRLRAAQRRSIKGLERSFAKGQEKALIVMATGSGKTYTVVQSSYRLLRHARAHRVLFLVDRNNLGEQAYNAYRGFTPLGSERPLHQQMPLRLFNKGEVAESDKIVISTIQRLWCKLAGIRTPKPDDAEFRDDEDFKKDLDGFGDFETKAVDRLAGDVARVSYCPELPPDTFDVIVVDECHRSIYGRWQPVLDYFDAHVVGLTATPIDETFGFFDNNLVSQYSYSQAVADSVNVDYDIYKIWTNITERGSTIPELSEKVHPDGRVERYNSVIAKVHKESRAERWHTVKEADPYAPVEINQRVRSKDQIRLVVETFRDKLFTEIFPPVTDRVTGEIQSREIVPKTLFFAQNDLHADAIVAAVHTAFDAGPGFCRKITSQEPQAKKALSDFRNKPGMRIAVTVDMIATGTDIPALECLVFMRDIHTWSYFEQMKGRGARTIKDHDLRKVTRDAVHKDRFVIVDAVGVTEHPKVDSRPLVRDDEPPVPGLERLLTACGEGRALHVDDVATLAGRLSRLGRRLDDQGRAVIEQHLSGRSYEEFVVTLVRAADTDRRAEARAQGEVVDEGSEIAAAVRPLTDSEALRAALLEAARDSWLLIDHLSRDQLIEARGLLDEEEARQVVDDWHTYMAEHEDQIAPLRIAFHERRSPREVLRVLKELIAKVRATRREWTEVRLWKAYVDLEIARGGPRRNAGLVEFLSIMRYELGFDGEDFQPYRSTVESRLEGWLARQETAGVTFDDRQRAWLRRVADVVAANATVSVKSLMEGHRRMEGGYGDFVDAFRNSRWEPVKLVDELDKELGA
ncbi:DEAD/DEAH box helicase family protein [Streptomyces sp. Li-HN-5-11]|uniref:DEAD/DEAH box helicase family protein n=1 Tax=Streptomyces sp. Li-HN-5-11 TaxID=3075432 RepID=UPI0028A957BC|nr:DEAD/DEAH box helicase family protein [Streptomyces sp. Li-HN-5-11]WNM29209.1 DEAD/DEAH box helicase family protein [Streptomyces sp. Li-HN-5-11]